MRVPVNWLREYVDFDASAEELAERLTFAGLEVEGIETVGFPCDKVVVGEVLSIVRHPTADNLLLCAVNAGNAELQTVCGARNFRVGDKVPLALEGATLAGGETVATTEIRGVRSQGMLCAEDELGISADHTGLMLLPRDLAPGAPFATVVGPPEPVLAIEVTPNRPDCLSMIGIAREVAALYGSALRMPSPACPETGADVNELARVAVEDPIGCPRYTARAVTGITVGPSPLWMKLRLIQGGVRPISNIVDITNYVMLEYGQPLHAFDRRVLAGAAIVVRRARAGERIVTLDGVGRALSPDMLVIADAGKPVALAGIMGGVGSEIQDDTLEVLLESACFNAPDIRRTSRAVGLSSEASYRFERGIDPYLAEAAGARAAAFMRELAGGTVARGMIDVFATGPDRKVIRCRYGRIRDLIGSDVSAKRMAEIFAALQLRVETSDEHSCTVRIPSFRPDLVIEADLAEEVARVHGIDKIPARAPRVGVVSSDDDSPSRAARVCRNALVGLGLNEIVNYSFISPELADRFEPGDAPRYVRLPNPVSADQSILRPSLLPQMVSSLGYNLARQAAEAALFEMGRVFWKDGEGRLREEERLAVGLMGPVGRGGLDKRRPVEAEEVFLWIKGILEALCGAMGAPELSLEPATPFWGEKDHAASVSVASPGGRQPLGVLGVVKAPLRGEWRMARPVAVLEARLSPLLAAAFHVPAVKPVAAYPAVARDMAIIVNAAVRHEEVTAIVRKIAPPELTGMELFDIYSGEGIGLGRKSLAYSFQYRSLDRTLTDEEANRLHESVKSQIARELSAEIREG